MSSDQEKAIIGGLVLEHGEVKRRLVALDVEAKRIQSLLSRIEAALGQPMLIIRSPKPTELDKNLDALPNPEAIKAIVEEIKEKKQRMQELQASLKQYGVEVTN
jgi:hypothetical protein